MKRLYIALPCFVVGAVLIQIDFSVVWRYFAWSNQTLAAIMLWTATAYLLQNARSRWHSLITALPATFMTATVCTYIVTADEGLRLGMSIALPVGIIVAAAALIFYLVKLNAAKPANRQLPQ